MPEAQAALAGREIAWLSDPIEALVLHIQGSGRLRITEADGSVRLVRLAYAGTNDQPYKSVGRWLLDRNLITDASWPGISAWIAANRTACAGDAVEQLRAMCSSRKSRWRALTRSSAPRARKACRLRRAARLRWTAAASPMARRCGCTSKGMEVEYKRLVVAQDTGSAIWGRARRLFHRLGQEAGDLAGRIKQPLRLWALWPKGLPVPQ